MLYNIISNFRMFGSSKMRHRVRFVKNINSFYTEFLFMMAAKRSDKKWQDGETEKLIDLYEENPCLWNIFHNRYQKRDVKERAMAAIADELDVQITDIKSKWKAIQGQFGRELNKVKSSKSRQSTDDLFWDKLQFLQSVIRQQKAEIHFRLAMIVFKLMHLFHQMKKVVSLARNQRRRQNSLKERNKKIDNAKTELLTSYINVLKEPSAAPLLNRKKRQIFSFFILLVN